MTKAFPVVVGLDENAEDIVHDFASPWHLALQGMTRSGKSVLSYGLLAGLVRYSEVKIVGSDISSVLLAPWAYRREGQAVIGDADMPAHVAVIEGVLAESRRRTSTFYGARIDKLEDFTADRPLIVCVLEEYPGLLDALAEDDEASGRKAGQKLAPRMKRAVSSLVAQGAKAGIRVVLLAQRFEAGIIGGATRSNFGFRVSLRVDNQDSIKMLHPSAPEDTIEQVELFQPGQGLLDRPGVPRVVFRARHVPDYAKWLDYVEKHLPELTPSREAEDLPDVPALVAT